MIRVTYKVIKHCMFNDSDSEAYLMGSSGVLNERVSEAWFASVGFGIAASSTAWYSSPI